MARILMDGFEIGAYSYDWSQSIGGYYFSMGLVTSPTHLSGAYSYKCQRTSSHATLYTSNGFARRPLPSTYSKLYVKCNFYFNNPEGQQIGVIGVNEGTASGGISAQIRLNTSTGDFYLYVNGSLVSTVAGLVTPGAWYLIEMLYDYAGSNVVVKLNYSEVINYSGSIDNNIDNIFIFNAEGGNKYNYYEMYMDDVCVNDDTGSINNSWVGNSAIRLLKPSADGSNSDFTPLTGVDNYAMVDETPPDGDTTYNQTLTVGNIDTFDITAVPSLGTGQEINAVESVVVAKADVDACQVKHKLISGVTTDTGSAESALVAAYDLTRKIHDVDPNTSAQWTESNVNAVEVGYEMA